MPIQYTVDPDHPNLLISTVVLPFDPLIDSQAALKELDSYLTTLTGKIAILSDIRQLDVTFVDMIIGIASIAFKEESPFRNERFIIAQVAHNEVYEKITDWLKDDLYGSINLPTFKSYAAAKAYLIQQLTSDTD